MSITRDLQFYIEDQLVEVNDLERILQQKIGNNPEIYISLHADKSVPLEYAVKIMNIAKNNNYKLILATTPE